jgi:preprotein translocase subunit SecA
MENMRRVRALGGLHVIGTERHEARRIDNQLRGRAARQGDPGSSRFYLSMEDELMRLFGGQQADALMQRMKIDDAIPLEVGLVGRLVEQSQTRVEGANFDVRKHLLEYDDVLNTQRGKIYAQRNRVFTKEDLSEDVDEMLRTEVARRVPESLADEEGPWKLLSWLETIQPPLNVSGKIYPSFTLRLIADRILGGAAQVSRDRAAKALLDVARDSLLAEQEHILRAVNQLLDQTEDRLEDQIKERMEMLDTFLEGLEVEEEGVERRPADVLAELSNAVRMPVQASKEQQRLLVENPRQVVDPVRGQVERLLRMQAVARVVVAVERRLEESLEINPSQVKVEDWDAFADQILDGVENTFARRIERYLGNGVDASQALGTGQMAKDLDNALKGMDESLTRKDLFQLLNLMPQGSRASFDRKTHRRVWTKTNRLTYLFYAARLLENREPEEVAEDVLDHLKGAQEALRETWGKAEFSRLAYLTPADLDTSSRGILSKALGGGWLFENEIKPLQEMSPDEQEKVVAVLGQNVLTTIYRQLILRVVTELWVDYLTQMEALRVSIGLEAYGQRDPLVQYKNRAFELFRNLLSDMRTGVISRMFTYRPREINMPQSAAGAAAPQAEAAQVAVPAGAAVQARQAEAAVEGAKGASRPTEAQTLPPDGGKQSKPDGKPAGKPDGKPSGMSSSKKRRRGRR